MPLDQALTKMSARHTRPITMASPAVQPVLGHRFKQLPVVARFGNKFNFELAGLDLDELHAFNDRTAAAGLCPMQAAAAVEPLAMEQWAKWASGDPRLSVGQ